ncbi:MAG: YebY family protein [Candidatus Malihini olakiniferum]
MKKIILAITITALGGDAVAAAKLATLSRQQYGDRWAFTCEEVQLICRPGKAVFALNTGTLMQYPLNAAAQTQMKSGQVNAQPIDIIWLGDPSQPNSKKDLQPFIERGEQLCANN